MSTPNKAFRNVPPKKKKKGKAKPKNAPNKGKQPARAAAPVVRYQPQLSTCAELFLKAAVDPFRYNYGKLPCIPDSFNALTQRARIHAFGSGATCTTSGFGFVSAGVNSFVTSDLSGGQVTDGAGNITTIGTAATGIINWTGDAPYASTAFTQIGKQFRVVGAGLRVMYIGTELSMQGQIQGIVSPTGTGYLDGYSVTNSSAIQSVVPQSFANRKWHEVILPIRSADDTKMIYTPDGGSSMALMIFGTAGTSLPFLWEFVSYVEYSGQSVVGAVPSESDPTGFAAATTAIAKTYGTHQKNYSWQQVKREAVKYLHEIGPRVVSAGMKAGAKALVSLI